MVNKLLLDKVDKDKVTELKKHNETPENCAALDETSRSTDLKFQKFQKSLVKGMIVVVSVLNRSPSPGLYGRGKILLMGSWS